MHEGAEAGLGGAAANRSVFLAFETVRTYVVPHGAFPRSGEDRIAVRAHGERFRRPMHALGLGYSVAVCVDRHNFAINAVGVFDRSVDIWMTRRSDDVGEPFCARPNLNRLHELSRSRIDDGDDGHFAG